MVLLNQFIKSFNGDLFKLAWGINEHACKLFLKLSEIKKLNQMCGFFFLISSHDLYKSVVNKASFKIVGKIKWEFLRIVKFFLGCWLDRLIGVGSARCLRS